MFFVTLLLNEVIAWMRNQSGTSSLRALLYMDEIFGYFPPTAMPPSKVPMLTLLKQARAFGVGVVLATQNPVDLDYKGLSNAGTWLIGRLQTERDKQRVIEGLESALATSADTFDRATIDKLLSGLGNRVFLMRNVHDDAPLLMQSRWALSYLRGPLTLPEIQRLMAERKSSRCRDDAGRGGRDRSHTCRILKACGSGGRDGIFPASNAGDRRDQLSPGAGRLCQAALRRCEVGDGCVAIPRLPRCLQRRRQERLVGGSQADRRISNRWSMPGLRVARALPTCRVRRCGRRTMRAGPRASQKACISPRA